MGRRQEPPTKTLIRPFKGMNKEIKGFLSNFYIKFRVQKQKFWLSPEVLEGLGSSGRLVGSISTYPGTCQCPWSRVMTKNPGGAHPSVRSHPSLSRPVRPIRAF